MSFPEAPVQIGSLDVSSIDRAAGRISQSGANTLLAAMNHLAFDFNYTPTLAGFMNRSVIQIRINDLFWITWAVPFACRCHRNQFVKQLE
jgi:hypothetical protein